MKFLFNLLLKEKDLNKEIPILNDFRIKYISKFNADLDKDFEIYLNEEKLNLSGAIYLKKKENIISK